MSCVFDALDRTERLTAGLTVVFLTTLALTAVVDEPTGWLGWGIAMILVTGTVLVLVNRSSSIE